MILYIPVESPSAAGTEKSQTFGICAYAHSDGQWQRAAQHERVSADLHSVVTLCDKCNKGQLSPLHLCDVVNDVH